jgi:release factor glutamine methyltransferase
MTLRDWLAQAGAQLSAGPHPDRARLDAETLLLHLIGKNKAWLMAHAEDDFAGCTAIRYASLLERRRKGEPIQYITGETEFYGLPFRVTPDVLIPRPETEILVERVGTLVPLFPKPRIVDIGTGSGAIAIALAHHWPSAQITAIDVSNSALDLAMSNAKRIGFADQIRFLKGNLLSPVAQEQFDIIVSNPPYVPAADRDSLSVEVRDHEPDLALFAGIDGLEVYRRLIPEAFAALAPGGFLALEIGYGQQPAIDSLLINAGFSNVQFTPDLQGISRVAVAQRL